MTTHVSSADELLQAVHRFDAHIEVRGTITGIPMVTLGAGTRLTGGTLVFGARGVRLTADNSLEDIEIRCPEHEIAVWNATDVADFGLITLRNVTTTGQVLLIAQDQVRAGEVSVDGLTVDAADLRGRGDRPHGFGVDVLQGAFTLWNRQPDPAVVLRADLRGISTGSASSPIRGSGIFVGGHSDADGSEDGGTIEVATLETGLVVTDGGIVEGTPDLISGGVFIQPGGRIDRVRNTAPVTTNGPNDMVLDNWGTVRDWVAEAPIVSHGASGIGFVNFGALDTLRVEAPIETFGGGARGFNLYDGTLRSATFTSITTHGDGAVGIQVTKTMPELTVLDDVRTVGGIGTSLVRGVQVSLQATAISVKATGRIDTLAIGGQVETRGDAVTSLELLGPVETIAVAGGVHARGNRSDAVHLRVGAARLGDVDVTADHGHPIVELAADEAND